MDSINTKELEILAKENKATIISENPFVAKMDGVEYSNQYFFRKACRDKVWTGVYNTVHNGWNK